MPAVSNIRVLYQASHWAITFRALSSKNNIGSASSYRIIFNSSHFTFAAEYVRQNCILVIFWQPVPNLQSLRLAVLRHFILYLAHNEGLWPV